MLDGRRSSTAQMVAVVRVWASSVDLIDDPYARRLLAPPWSMVAPFLACPVLARATRTSAVGYLVARTRAFDDIVGQAVEDGVPQIVVVGAGYDSRAWRFRRPGTQFFEVDHPATQADKRRRAPAAGPVYVPVNLEAGGLRSGLLGAGLVEGALTLFIVEGLTMYLDEAVVARLLGQLRELGGDGSRLAVNFGVGFAREDTAPRRVLSRAGRQLISARRETFRFELAPSEVDAFLDAAGWRTDEVLTGSDLSYRYLQGTVLEGLELNPMASFALASGSH